MKKKLLVGILVSNFLSTAVLSAEVPSFDMDKYTHGSFTSAVVAQATKVAVPDFEKLNETESRYEQLMAESERNASYASISKISGYTLLLGGLLVGMSSTETNESGKKELDSTGKTAVGVAVIGGAIGGLLGSYFSSKSHSLKSEAEKLSHGVSYDASTSALVYQATYRF